MGVTTGKLSADEQQVITITIPGTLTREQGDELATALNQVIDAFNNSHPGGEPWVSVS
jgi:hypothetical protein